MPQLKTLKVLPGCSDHPHGDWLIGPVGHTRDSDLLAESNWHTVTEAYLALDPEGLDHEVHRFGHWACGWVEEVAYRPGSAVALMADRFRARLDDYPILDESDLETREMAAVDDNWHEIARDLKRALQTHYEREQGGWTEDHADRLDDLSDEALHGAAHEYGEYAEGWVKYSDSDVRKIAAKLAPLLQG